MESKYCAAPWRGLHINFRGDVKTCCAGDPNMLGTLETQTIHDIVHGPKMREIRETIRSGQLHPKYCVNCIRAEKYGRSERHWHNDVNQDFDVAQASPDHFDPTIIDIRWNTTCNLSCNYCHEYCSSKWLAIKKGTAIKNAVRPYYEQVCDFLVNHATHIREVAMVGGEPLLLPENQRLLDVIPADCIVTLITNMSVDFEKNPIVQKLRQRRRVGWSMSFDNTGERFAYVRHGGNWDLINQNIDTVQTLMSTQGHWGGIHAVYNVYNCTRLVEFREWAHLRGLTVLWQTLYQPACLDPLQHNFRLRMLAQQEARRLLDTCGSFMEQQEIDFFTHVIKALDSEPPNGDHAQLLAQHVARIETLYHQDTRGQFVKLWPELAFVME